MKKAFLFVLVSIAPVYITYTMQQSALPSENIVKVLLEAKAQNKKNRTAPMSVYEEVYPKYEAKFEQYKQLIPKYAVAGGINYLMSWNDISATVKAKFQELYMQGKVMTEEQFNKLPKEAWFPRLNDLTRVWGAQHLAQGFKEKGVDTWKVPDYIIVVKDLSAIQVKINMLDSCFPVVKSIENGAIYAKTIQGTPIGTRMGRSGYDSTGLGYTDFSSEGNIVETKDGSKYFLDTEYKSFYDGLPGRYLFNNIRGWGLMCEYFKERFQLLNQITASDKTITFSLP